MRYLSYESLIELYLAIVRDEMQETYFGVLNEALLRSALARPHHAAVYESASALRQAAYLFHGILMNHGFKQGNKRAAYAALEWFLHSNHLGEVTASDEEIISMCYAAENEKWSVDQIEDWLKQHVRAA